MKDGYDFSVKVQPYQEDRIIVDVSCVLMNSNRKGYMAKSSWICDVSNGPKVIEDSLIAACRWLNACAEKEECKFERV